MSIKSKIMNVIASNPKLLTFGIGFVIAVTVSATRGLISTINALSFGGGGINVCHSLRAYPKIIFL
jgi:hypothetical protein